ncbi:MULTISPECIES: hypothetical protein [Nocardiopsis]|uniref:Uncharacterized protein n=1 Tax=Nocardiopsis lambiniae TaxID=3075539 RepID=A0ABU2M648_9ACTN|nr:MULTISPECIES: hypothetical protein [unclassified Nocardiopsis]MDE3724659.1 hypothetical protein [Nocardiopsis sp. N85]MDT0328143.1 hypothetical protein [Nocardiopsis sp. DSM 44743]
MSPVQIIRTVAAALIAGGAALGLVPGGSCGAGWWSLPSTGDSFGWFAYTPITDGPPVLPQDMCETATAPLGSWAIALVVMGAVLLAGAWFTTSHRSGGEPKE